MSDSKTPEELQEAFVQAAKIADAVPEAYRAVAFQRALDALLTPVPSGGKGGATDRGSAASGGAHQRSRPAAREGGADARTADVVAMLIASLNRTELAELMAGRKVLDRALLVLRAAQHHEIDEMSAQEIAAVLTQKFRERTSANAVRMALERSPSYTDRRMRNGTVVYSLMGAGERYIEGLGQTDDQAGGAPSRRRRPTGSAKRGGRLRERAKAPVVERVNDLGDTSTSSSGDPAPAAPTKRGSRNGNPARRSSGRPGPKALLEELLKHGLFDTPQTLGSILDYVERKRGHRYKPTDFSPTLTRLLREDKLDRDRNPEGQYEYRKHGSS